MSLLDKYNVAAPRYTSYPTVPYWEEEQPNAQRWSAHVADAFAENPEISLYIHLPFCESLCTYCGCNKRITKNHQVEAPYIDTVLQEWQLYLDVLPGKPILKEVHLGGGTPTFFAPSELKRLINGLTAGAFVPEDRAYGFEAHPGSTSREHLETLFELGFERLSIGVQDFAPEILAIINRHQTREEVEQVTRWAREIGYTSINYDLIFGLPLQTPEHIRTTVAYLEDLQPERIAFYSYAHVPWIKPSQRAYSEADLPTGKEKRALYELGRNLLEAMGYQEIGMDHFALPHDELCQAFDAGTLHRNFMGYTPFATRLSIGLGVSAIGDTWTAFMQNEKKLEDYQSRVEAGEFPLHRGHWLTESDQVIRRQILNLMCQGQTSWEEAEPVLDEGWERLAEMEGDGLLHRCPRSVTLTEAGLPFVRNACLAFDARYWKKQPEGRLFSQVV
jgi:oxygen-independent coproporphyrinogen-3 oxidase